MSSAFTPTPSGEMNKFVVLWQRSNGAPTFNELGEAVNAAVNLGTVKAKVRPLSAREILANAQNDINITHDVRIRWNDAFTHTDYIVFQGTRILDVLSITNLNEESREAVISCNEQK